MTSQNNLRIELVKSTEKIWRVLLVRDLAGLQDAITHQRLNSIPIRYADCGGIYWTDSGEWEFKYAPDIESADCEVLAELKGRRWANRKSAKSDLQNWYSEKREK